MLMSKILRQLASMVEQKMKLLKQHFDVVLLTIDSVKQ